MTAMFQYAHTHPDSKKAWKPAKTESGMVVAQTTAIAFVPTKLGRGRQKEEKRNALDDFCNSVGSVVTGCC
jgi:hypothetical protein